MRPRRGQDGVDGDADVAVGAVLEAHRSRQAAGQFAVHLAFRGARTDGTPGDQVADVLRTDDVEKFAACRHAQAVDVHQQLPRDAQAFVDAEGLVEVGVVDQPLPAHRGARLLEVHPHHDFELSRVLVALGLQLARVLQRGHGVVDRTGADDDEQPVAAVCTRAVHDAPDAVTRVLHQRLHRCAGDGEETDQMLGRRQRRDVADALVVGLAGALAQGQALVGRGRGLGVHERSFFGL